MKCKDCDRLSRFTNICSYYFKIPDEREAEECEHFSPRVEDELPDYECKSASLKFLASQGGPWCAVLYEAAEAIDSLWEEYKQAKRERDAAIAAVKNMAEYIVCVGRVDCFLCDEISMEHHLKYQPHNDGNYDNAPCYECIADWFLQGHKWEG